MNIDNKYKAIAIIAGSPSMLMASGKMPSHPIWLWLLNNIVFLISFLVIAGAFIALYDLLNAILVSKRREILRSKGIEPEPLIIGHPDTFLSRWYKSAWNLLPIEKEGDIQLDHDYDGIKELDNSLPPWWIYGFYLTIVIAIGYIYVYHYSEIGLSQEEEYAIAIEKGALQRANFEAKQANSFDEKNLLALTDEESLNIGFDQFRANCTACHGAEGQGGVGPNLTDDYWIHGGSTSSIYKTIKYGVPEKGMIAWKAQMQPSTMYKIASYIEVLKGTSPANPKAPEGKLYEPESDEINVILEE